MTRLTLATVLVLGSLSLSVAARADDRSALASAARSGAEVYVTYADGIERRGRIAQLDDAGLHVAFGGRVTLVPWDEVVTVDRRGDPIWDGALRGAGVAAAFYGAVAILGGARADEVAPFIASAALAWGAAGAVVDAFNVGRSRVYVAPATTVTRQAPNPRRPWDRVAGASPVGVVVGIAVGF
jgi:hypothetical protein